MRLIFLENIVDYILKTKKDYPSGVFTTVRHILNNIEDKETLVSEYFFPYKLNNVNKGFNLHFCNTDGRLPTSSDYKLSLDQAKYFIELYNQFHYESTYPWRDTNNYRWYTTLNNLSLNNKLLTENTLISEQEFQNRLEEILKLDMGVFIEKFRETHPDLSLSQIKSIIQEMESKKVYTSFYRTFVEVYLKHVTNFSNPEMDEILLFLKENCRKDYYGFYQPRTRQVFFEAACKRYLESGDKTILTKISHKETSHRFYLSYKILIEYLTDNKKIKVKAGSWPETYEVKDELKDKLTEIASFVASKLVSTNYYNDLHNLFWLNKQTTYVKELS